MKKRSALRRTTVASAGLNNGRTYALYRAGRELLASNDFDNVSIARIAALAECSVGAFYERFPDKSSYMIFLIRHEFRTKKKRLENKIGKTSCKKYSKKTVIDEIAKFLTEEFSSEKTAGIVRAALKLGPTELKALIPVTEFRDFANDATFEALRPILKGRDTKQRVAEALQIAFSVIFDAIQQGYGPLKLNKPHMATALSHQIQARLVDILDTSSDGAISARKASGSASKTKYEETAANENKIAESNGKSIKKRKLNVF